MVVRCQSARSEKRGFFLGFSNSENVDELETRQARGCPVCVM